MIRNVAKHFGCCSNIKFNFHTDISVKYSILLWRSFPGLFVNCVHKDNQIHYPFYLLYAPPYFLLHNHKYNYSVSYIKIPYILYVLCPLYYIHTSSVLKPFSETFSKLFKHTVYSSRNLF